MADYTTEEQLQRIREWPWQETAAMFEFVRSIWWNAEWGIKVCGYRWFISTGGWSGNEQIIGAMQDNEFVWGLVWQSSKRGGHYEFELLPWMLNKGKEPTNAAEEG